MVVKLIRPGGGFANPFLNKQMGAGISSPTAGDQSVFSQHQGKNYLVYTQGDYENSILYGNNKSAATFSPSGKDRLSIQYNSLVEIKGAARAQNEDEYQISKLRFGDTLKISGEEFMLVDGDRFGERKLEVPPFQSLYEDLRQVDVKIFSLTQSAEGNLEIDGTGSEKGSISYKKSWLPLSWNLRAPDWKFSTAGFAFGAFLICCTDFDIPLTYFVPWAVRSALRVFSGFHFTPKKPRVELSDKKYRTLPSLEGSREFSTPLYAQCNSKLWQAPIDRKKMEIYGAGVERTPTFDGEQVARLVVERPNLKRFGLGLLNIVSWPLRFPFGIQRMRKWDVRLYPNSEGAVSVMRGNETFDVEEKGIVLRDRDLVSINGKKFVVDFKKWNHKLPPWSEVRVLKEKSEVRSQMSETPAPAAETAPATTTPPPETEPADSSTLTSPPLPTGGSGLAESTSTTPMAPGTSSQGPGGEPPATETAPSTTTPPSTLVPPPQPVEDTDPEFEIPMGFAVDEAISAALSGINLPPPQEESSASSAGLEPMKPEEKKKTGESFAIDGAPQPASEAGAGEGQSGDESGQRQERDNISEPAKFGEKPTNEKEDAEFWRMHDELAQKEVALKGLQQASPETSVDEELQLGTSDRIPAAKGTSGGFKAAIQQGMKYKESEGGAASNILRDLGLLSEEFAVSNVSENDREGSGSGLDKVDEFLGRPETPKNTNDADPVESLIGQHKAAQNLMTGSDNRPVVGTLELNVDDVVEDEALPSMSHATEDIDVSELLAQITGDFAAVRLITPVKSKQLFSKGVDEKNNPDYNAIGLRPGEIVQTVFEVYLKLQDGRVTRLGSFPVITPATEDDVAISVGSFGDPGRDPVLFNGSEIKLIEPNLPHNYAQLTFNKRGSVWISKLSGKEVKVIRSGGVEEQAYEIGAQQNIVLADNNQLEFGRYIFRYHHISPEHRLHPDDQAAAAVSAVNASSNQQKKKVNPTGIEIDYMNLEHSPDIYHEHYKGISWPVLVIKNDSKSTNWNNPITVGTEDSNCTVRLLGVYKRDVGNDVLFQIASPMDSYNPIRSFAIKFNSGSIENRFNGAKIGDNEYKGLGDKNIIMIGGYKINITFIERGTSATTDLQAVFNGVNQTPPPMSYLMDVETEKRHPVFMGKKGLGFVVGSMPDSRGGHWALTLNHAGVYPKHLKITWDAINEKFSKQYAYDQNGVETWTDKVDLSHDEEIDIAGRKYRFEIDDTQLSSPEDAINDF
ncbi:MAG: hypothetical protein ABIE74_02965 [Pseudomonadota bacterium]